MYATAIRKDLTRRGFQAARSRRLTKVRYVHLEGINVSLRKSDSTAEMPLIKIPLGAPPPPRHRASALWVPRVSSCRSSPRNDVTPTCVHLSRTESRTGRRAELLATKRDAILFFVFKSAENSGAGVNFV